MRELTSFHIATLSTIPALLILDMLSLQWFTIKLSIVLLLNLLLWVLPRACGRLEFAFITVSALNITIQIGSTCLPRESNARLDISLLGMRLWLLVYLTMGWVLLGCFLLVILVV